MRVVVLGTGGRGGHYIRFSLDEGVEVVAIADSNTERMKKIATDLNLHGTVLYDDAEALLAAAPEADACVIALPDTLHYDYGMRALELGYHVLIEKPLALSEAHCRGLVEEAEKRDRHLMVCHVLRYAPFFEKIKEIVDSGALGEIMNFQLTENVAYWHYAHSYVRGIFSNTEHSAPFILAKSCHDLDIIAYITGKRAVSVVSEGGLFHFKPENAPEGAPKFCLDGCPAEKTCPYFAPKRYLAQIDPVGWPSNTISVETDYNSRLEALKTGRYGRCVYHSDNNVNDHQSAIFTMEDGSTASFNMSGLSSENTRILRIFGTKGDLTGHLERNELILADFKTGTREQVHYDTVASVQSGHGGGDARLYRDFVQLCRGELTDSKSSARLSLQSHLMAFAAEESVRTGRRIAIETN